MVEEIRSLLKEAAFALEQADLPAADLQSLIKRLEDAASEMEGGSNDEYPFKATVIFGSDAVSAYLDGQFTEQMLEEDGALGKVHRVAFKTQEELDAWFEGVDAMEDWFEWVLADDLDKTETQEGNRGE